MKDMELYEIRVVGNNSPLFISTNNGKKLYTEMDDFFGERMVGFKRVGKVNYRGY